MNLVDVTAVVMFAAVVLYAVFAGADFGSGVWDLTAGDAKTGARTRTLIDRAIGPVWEANHVWLIFVLVVLWTAFPAAFTALMRTLGVPFWLAGLGIVLRGAGFAFRKFAPTLGWARVAGAVFAGSSLVTPFFLGTIAGAVASGRVPAEGAGQTWTSWLNATSLVGGVLAVSTCTFVAGVFLAAAAERHGDHELAEALTRRSLVVGAVTGVIVIAGIVPLAVDAGSLFDGLTGRAAPFVVVSASAGTASLWFLRRHRRNAARVAAVSAVASVTAGWGVAQYPWILVDELKLTDAAAESAVLTGLVVAFALAAILVVPPMVMLFRLADRDNESQ